jgi:hypothetical protein
MSFFEDEVDDGYGTSGYSSKKSKSKSRSLYDYDDDYYGYGYSGRGYGGYGYGGYGKSKYGSFDTNLWSGYSWGNSSIEDDNSKLFVKDPISYVTPTSKDIRKKANVWQDKQTDTIKELARVCYFKMIDERNYISEKFSDYDSLNDSDKSNYDTKKSLYDSIFENFIPGFTPLEQAISIFRKMSSSESKRSEGSEDELDFESTLSFDRALYTDPELNEQLDFNELSKKYKMDILDKISIIGSLGEQFKVEKEVSEKLVSNSDKYSKKIMRDYAQLSNIELYQKMFPNFSTKFLTKDLIVNVPVERKEQKQKIIILLDFSGSMDYESKQIWVNAILIDRLKYVMKGEAEVFFSYFVHSTKGLKFIHLKDREDVMNFWSTFSNYPNGGTTDIGGIVTYIDNEVSEGRLHNLDIDLSQERPEILIINDGQDRVGYDTLPYKVNAISLECFSEELKDLCVGTGGKQVFINVDTNEGTCYSKGAEAVKLNTVR